MCSQAVKLDEAKVWQAFQREEFYAFAAKAFTILEPGTEFEWNWHLELVCKHLEAAYRGEERRIIFNVPPRTLKSFLVARAFPAWVMGKNPGAKFIVTSYGHQVAEQNSMACRRIMKDPWYQALFPATKIRAELDRNDHFETTQGGQYYAATALSPITGIGCHYMIVDDPIKPMEASSPTIRESTNENFRATLFSRYDDKRTGRFIMVMQRVHEDDPTGFLNKDGSWKLIKLPAETKHDISVTLGDRTWTMNEGDLLFPARLSRDILDQTRKDMSEYHYVGQYLQDPVPLGGGEFKEEWVQMYGPGIKAKEMNIVILVDPSGGEDLNKKKKKTSDWTVMAVIGLAPDNNYYLLDMIRDRLNPTDRIDTLFMLHRLWNEKCGRPPKVGYEKYGMMTDTHYIDQKKRTDSYNFPLIELGGPMMKEERIRRLIPDMQNGRWYFPGTLPYVDSEGRKFDLMVEMKSEMASFPKARFDDILDSMSRVYEPELNLVFPKKRDTITGRAIRTARARPEESWEDM